jgi:hypothetical protein
MSHPNLVKIAEICRCARWLSCGGVDSFLGTVDVFSSAAARTEGAALRGEASRQNVTIVLG